MKPVLKCNVPMKSWRKGKKKVVKACLGNKVKVIHFGDTKYKHDYSKKAKQNYLKRSAGIRDKQGRLTKDNIFSANYWSRKILWPKN